MSRRDANYAGSSGIKEEQTFLLQLNVATCFAAAGVAARCPKIGEDSAESASLNMMLGITIIEGH